MPSGSHGGGGHCGSSGGGHSSHSSHSGGHSSSGGSSGFGRPGVYHGRSVRFFYFGGRRYYAPSKVSNVLSIVFAIVFIALIATFVCWANYGEYDAQIESFERDYANYQRMIQRADSNPDYLLEDAKITGIYQCDVSPDYYHINYSFKNAKGKDIDGYTYCTYTYADILDKGYSVGGYITLAIDCNKNNIVGDVDSIDYDYKYTTLEDDADYVNYKQSLDKFSVLWKVMLGISVAFIVGGIVVVVLTFKKTKDDEEKEERLAEIKKEEEKRKSEPRRCAYCGSLLKDGEIECKNCGGRTDL